MVVLLLRAAEAVALGEMAPTGLRLRERRAAGRPGELGSERIEGRERPRRVDRPQLRRERERELVELRVAPRGERLEARRAPAQVQARRNRKPRCSTGCSGAPGAVNQAWSRNSRTSSSRAAAASRRSSSRFTTQPRYSVS